MKRRVVEVTEIVHGKRLGARSEQQDMIAQHRGDGWDLVVVCDGMGGHNGGATAAKMCCDIVVDRVASGMPSAVAGNRWKTNWLMDVAGLLQNAIDRADSLIRTASYQLDGCAGMGTTIVAAIVTDTGLAVIAHVGDSRAYRVWSPKPTRCKVASMADAVREARRAVDATRAEMRGRVVMGTTAKRIGAIGPLHEAAVLDLDRGFTPWRLSLGAVKPGEASPLEGGLKVVVEAKLAETFGWGRADVYCDTPHEERFFVEDGETKKVVSRLTEDHTLEAEQKRRNASCAFPNVVTRSVGQGGALADITVCQLGEGDVLVLSSDGLNGAVNRLFGAVMERDSLDQRLMAHIGSIVWAQPESGGMAMSDEQGVNPPLVDQLIKLLDSAEMRENADNIAVALIRWGHRRRTDMTAGLEVGTAVEWTRGDRSYTGRVVLVEPTPGELHEFKVSRRLIPSEFGFSPGGKYKGEGMLVIESTDDRDRPVFYSRCGKAVQPLGLDAFQSSVMVGDTVYNLCGAKLRVVFASDGGLVLEEVERGRRDRAGYPRTGVFRSAKEGLARAKRLHA